MKVKTHYRWLIALFALWLAFEPLAVAMVRASDSPIVPEFIELDTEGIDGIVDIDIMPPKEYMDYTLALRGRTKEEAEANVWGEWMSSMSGAYMMMDDGCSDVFSFYSTMGAIHPHISEAPFYFKAVTLASSKAILAFSFIINSGPIVSGMEFVKNGVSAVAGTKIVRAAAGAVENVNDFVVNTSLYKKGVGFIQRKANLMNGLQRMGTTAANTWTKALKNTSTFLTHMAPPAGFRSVYDGVRIEGTSFESYWRWVSRKTGLENNEAYRNIAKKFDINTNRGAKVISDTKGVAHTVGIGLCVVGIALDVYGIVSSEDRQGGRYGSYSLVKNYIGLGLGAASLIGMFCIPVVGQIAGVLALVWLAVTTAGDIFGDYNKRWKAAYKNSYWYLYENDPEFKSFYDNRDLLNDNEKSASLRITESHYGGAQGDEKSLRIYTELEKQGVLTSYYGLKGFTLPDFGAERLMELWELKADYMSWKPTEAEEKKAANRGFWGKVGNAINPMNVVSWAGDKIQSRNYKKSIEEYNILKVFFNPDYVLLKKYQNWVTANNYRGGIYDAVSLRIEQSPFNYIPLVGIDTSVWDRDLLVETFNADAFFVGVKEMMYLTKQVEAAAEQVENIIDQNDDTVKYINEEHLEYHKEIKDGIETLMEYYNENPDVEYGELKEVIKTFGWRWNERESGELTPRNIVHIHKGDIEQIILYEPLSIAQKAADMALMVSGVKKNLDLAVVMRETGEEKLQLLQNFDNEFQNPDIKDYLKRGTFLNVKGKTFMDWLSEMYPAYEEMEKFTNLYMEEVEKFTKVADTANSDTRKVLLFFSKDGHDPKVLLGELNIILDDYKRIIEIIEEHQDDMGINVAELYRSDEMFSGVFTDFSVDDPVAMDIDAPVNPIGELNDVIPASY